MSNVSGASSKTIPCKNMSRTQFNLKLFKSFINSWTSKGRVEEKQGKNGSNERKNQANTSFKCYICQEAIRTKELRPTNANDIEMNIFGLCITLNISLSLFSSIIHCDVCVCVFVSIVPLLLSKNEVKKRKKNAQQNGQTIEIEFVRWNTHSKTRFLIKNEINSETNYNNREQRALNRHSFRTNNNTHTLIHIHMHRCGGYNNSSTSCNSSQLSVFMDFPCVVVGSHCRCCCWWWKKKHQQRQRLMIVTISWFARANVHIPSRMWVYLLFGVMICEWEEARQRSANAFVLVVLLLLLALRQIQYQKVWNRDSEQTVRFFACF